MSRVHKSLALNIGHINLGKLGGKDSEGDVRNKLGNVQTRLSATERAEEVAATLHGNKDAKREEEVAALIAYAKAGACKPLLPYQTVTLSRPLPSARKFSKFRFGSQRRFLCCGPRALHQPARRSRPPPKCDDVALTFIPHLPFFAIAARVPRGWQRRCRSIYWSGEAGRTAAIRLSRGITSDVDVGRQWLFTRCQPYDEVAA